MLRNDSNNMSNDLHQLHKRKNKLEEEPNHKISAHYSELMKKVSEGFHGMQRAQRNIISNKPMKRWIKAGPRTLSVLVK